MLVVLLQRSELASSIASILRTCGLDTVAHLSQLFLQPLGAHRRHLEML